MPQETYEGHDEKANTFLGKATIEFKVPGTTTKPINNVVLHINDLSIASYQFVGRTENVTLFNDADYNAANDKWTISLGDAVNRELDITLKVVYRGYMRDDMAGFYKSYYYQNGEKVWMASTQFQPSDARRVFPCFDVSQWPVINPLRY